MKKIIFLTLTLLTLCVLSHAQNAKSFYRSSYESRNSGSFNQSYSLVTLGYGFPNTALPGDGFGGYSSTPFGIGPMYLKYEHGFLRDEIGLGGHIAFSNAWERYTNGGTKYTNSVVAFSAAFKGFYHFNKLIPVKDLDVYASAGLSLWNRVYHYDSSWPANFNRPDHSGTQVVAVFQVGARYYVKPKLGLYAEAGYDQMSSINFGVTFKL